MNEFFFKDTTTGLNKKQNVMKRLGFKSQKKDCVEEFFYTVFKNLEQMKLCVISCTATNM